MDNRENKVQVSHLTKQFGDLLVLNDISFNVKKGEFLCIVGPTGCGKTTFLNSLTKLYQPTKGEILINGEVVDLKKHNIAYIFQEYSTMPWLTVEENVRFGLDIKHIDDAEHQKLTKQSNRHILEFAEYLKEKGVPVWIRHVVVPGITLNDDYLRQLGHFIGGLDNLKALDVLPYHTMGEVKYENLGIDYPLKGVPAATKEQAIHAKQVIFEGIKERIREDIQKH